MTAGDRAQGGPCFHGLQGSRHLSHRVAQTDPGVCRDLMSKAAEDTGLVPCCWGRAMPEPAVASAEGRSGAGSQERSSGRVSRPSTSGSPSTDGCPGAGLSVLSWGPSTPSRFLELLPGHVSLGGRPGLGGCPQPPPRPGHLCSQ